MPQRWEKREAKGVSKDKKRGRCLESEDTLLSFEGWKVRLKEFVSLCIYIFDFMRLPPMTHSQDVHQESKVGK